MRSGESYRFGHFLLDVDEREERRDGVAVSMTAKSFDLLLLLVRGAGRTFTKAELLQGIWPDTAVEEGNLTQTVFMLRKALAESQNGDASDYILTVPRRGYKFVGNVTREGSRDQESPAAPPQPVLRPRLLWIALAAAAFASTAALYLYQSDREARMLAATIVPPENALFDFATRITRPAVSPDGRRIVFGARGTDGVTRLWLRPLDSPAAEPLPGTENSRLPFWSPDSRTIAFFADGKLKRTSIGGGPPMVLADAALGQGGSWSPQGVIVFAPSFNAPLQRVAASGGTTSPAIAATVGRYQSSPWFLPDGRHFLFNDQPQVSSKEATLRIGSLDSSDVRTIGSTNSNAAYSEGYLLYLRETTLMAHPFDLATLTTKGEPAPVAQVRRMLVGASHGVFAVSGQGLLLYQAGTADSHQLTWFDRGGKPLNTIGEPGDFFSVDFSPDQKDAIATRQNSNTDLWIYKMSTGLATRFTFGPAFDGNGIWSPDGRRILYASSAKGHFDLYGKSADGSGGEELLFADNSEKYPASISPDGALLLFCPLTRQAQRDIWILPLGHSRSQPSPWLATPFSEEQPKFSPDGRWVAYASDESGQFEIYLARFTQPAWKRRISNSGGVFPRWRADGKEVFYVRPDGMLMAASLSPNREMTETEPVQPMGIHIATNRSFMYDVSADGQRFLAAAALDQKSPTPLTIVQNWTAQFNK